MGAAPSVAVILTLIVWFGSLGALVTFAVMYQRSRRAGQRLQRPRVRTIDRIRAAARWARWREETSDGLPGISRQQTAYRRVEQPYAQMQRNSLPPYPQGQRNSLPPYQQQRNSLPPGESMSGISRQQTAYHRAGYQYPPTQRNSLPPDDTLAGLTRQQTAQGRAAYPPAQRGSRPPEGPPRRSHPSDPNGPPRRLSDWAPDPERWPTTQQTTAIPPSRPDWRTPPAQGGRNQPPPPPNRRGQDDRERQGW